MIYGLDLSLTATGIATLWKSGEISAETLGVPPSVRTAKGLVPQRIEARLLRLVELIEGRLVEPELVVIEGLSFGSNDPSAQERAALQLIIRINLYLRGVPFLVVPPTSLKKFTCGKGNAPKGLMINEVYKRWGYSAADDDQADAVALAHVGAAQLGRLPDLIQPQKEVLAKLNAPPVEKKRRRKNV